MLQITIQCSSCFIVSPLCAYGGSILTLCFNFCWCKRCKSTLQRRYRFVCLELKRHCWQSSCYAICSKLLCDSAHYACAVVYWPDTVRSYAARGYDTRNTRSVNLGVYPMKTEGSTWWYDKGNYRPLSVISDDNFLYYTSASPNNLSSGGYMA